MGETKGSNQAVQAPLTELYVPDRAASNLEFLCYPTQKQGQEGGRAGVLDHRDQIKHKLTNGLNAASTQQKAETPIAMKKKVWAINGAGLFAKQSSRPRKYENMK